MPKPPPAGSPRPRKAILIHDDDDRGAGHRGSRSVGGQGGRRVTFGDFERGRERPPNSVGGSSAAARKNTLAPSSPFRVRAGAKEPEVIEIDDDDGDGYEVRREKAAARVEVKAEPLECSGSDSEDSRARGSAWAAASAPGGSRKTGKRKRESPVRRGKPPHRAGGRAEPRSSGKQRILHSSDESGGAPCKKVKSEGRRRHGHEGRDMGPHDAAPARQTVSVVASRTRSRDGERRKAASAAKGPARSVGSDDSGDDDYHDLSDESGGAPGKKLKTEGRRKRGHEGGGSDWRGSSPARQVGGGVSSRTCSRNVDGGKVASAAKHSASVVSTDSGDDDDDDDEMEEVSSDDNGESLDNQEEGQDAVKGKTKEEDDNSDSEDRYRFDEEEELGEDRNDIQDDSYAGVDEENTDDTTEQEEEEQQQESHEAGEELRRTPSSNVKAGGSTRTGGERTPPFRKRNFEGLCLVEKPDTTSAGEGIGKRTRSHRGCKDKKLLRRGTLRKPCCIEVTDSETEEEVPPPAQTEKVQAFEDDIGGDDGAPAKKRRRQQQIFRSDSEDSSDDSESGDDRTFGRNAKNGPSSSRPKNGGASYRQQQAAKEGCKDYEGCSNSNTRRVKNYAANAGNPADRGNLQQGDISFKKNALFPRKGKRGELSAKQSYDNLFNSIFDEIENHPNGSAPAQAHQGEDRLPLLFSFGDEDQVEEKPEHHELWADFDFALETVNGSPQDCEEGEQSNGQEIPADRATLCKQGKHDLVTDDQIGIWCQHCNFIHLEIRHVVAPMGKWSAEREPAVDRELDRSINDILTSMGYEGECSVGNHRSGPVWDLIPGVREDMFPHQIEAFEFMWNKLAGGTEIEQVKKNLKSDTLSGCVISHAPGTGKTRLAITFVQSYLELFPRCSPVIIAPKGMLATWENEFRKWNVKVPFHVLNSTDIHWDGDKTIQRLAAGREFAQKLSTNSFDRKYRQALKLLSWCEGNSVIGLSYKLFTNLTKEEGKGDDGKMRQLLLQSPDLLVLDEGHIPRNSNSQIWKALAKVRTQKRIILSGTPFQNNFEELHNILCLLRGSTHDVDPGKDEGKVFWTSLKLKNVTDERISEIRTKLDPFVHIHNGDILHKSLPGLRESVVILNPLPMQKKIIGMMEKYETQSNLDLEYKICLASVHPFLITTMEKLSNEVASSVDQPSLERSRLKPYEGVKARFVYEIVRRCHSKERVLVFSQYLDTLDLIREQLSTKFHWTKDKEILQMSGLVSEKTRQSLMMAFNDMNSDAKVMLASTRACSEGIQLIGASRVVLLDVVWNPSVGRQAIGRAYRIGQQKIVYTYNLIAEGTQEKSKYERQAQKDHMSKKLFSNKTQPAECNLSPDFIFSDRILEEMIEDENLKGMFVNVLPPQ